MKALKDETMIHLPYAYRSRMLKSRDAIKTLRYFSRFVSDIEKHYRVCGVEAQFDKRNGPDNIKRDTEKFVIEAWNLSTTVAMNVVKMRATDGQFVSLSLN